MPELPEVETVRRGLEKVVVGRRIVAVTVRRPDLRQPFPPRFADRLTGRRFTDLSRRAKYLLAGLDDANVLIVHLGMSGRLVVADKRCRGEGPHDHVVMDLDDGTRLVYSDARRFGLMTLAERGKLEAHPLLERVGVEPLSDAFDAGFLDRALAGKRAPIKAALLDQRLVAGIGNIYACEALFRAGISPRRSSATVPGARARRLSIALRAVLEDAIAAGGSSLRDYVRADGELGYFQHDFAVYDREGERCARPGCQGVVRRIVQAGRSTFYCGACQH